MTTEALNRIDPSEFATQREVVAALEAAARAADGHDSLGDECHTFQKLERRDAH